MIGWLEVAVVAVGAAAGGVLRYVVGVAFVQRFGPGFPVGTLFINISGSFAIGVIAELAQTRALGVSPLLRLMLVTGFIGGYTTFSTFSYELFTLTGEGSSWLACGYALASVLLGFLAAYGGVVLARALAR